MVSERDISRGLQDLGLSETSAVIVHSSLRSFGRVQGGASAVGRALASVCGTALVPAGSWDLTGLPAPPRLERPHNAVRVCADWPEFDAALRRAVPFSPDLPIDRVDRELGRIPEAMRQELPHSRGTHPLMSYLAVERFAADLVAAQRLDWLLGPLEALEALDGDVLLLGGGHTSDTTIHLAEQRLGRSRFYRYAKAAEGVWMELPNVPGQGHGFDSIEPELRGVTREVSIGACRARCVSVRAVLTAATLLITADPRALLCGSELPLPRRTTIAAGVSCPTPGRGCPRCCLTVAYAPGVYRAFN